MFAVAESKRQTVPDCCELQIRKCRIFDAACTLRNGPKWATEKIRNRTHHVLVLVRVRVRVCVRVPPLTHDIVVTFIYTNMQNSH